MSFTPKPLFAHVYITHAGTKYTLDNDLIEADPTISADGKAGQCDLTVRNDSSQYSGLFVPGDVLLLSTYKTGLAPVNLFGGPLMNIHSVQKYHKTDSSGTKENKHLQLSALDGSAYLQWRLANTAYQTLQATAIGQSIDTIVKDLVTNKANLWSVQSGIPGAAALPITVNNVQSIPVYIKSIVFAQMSVFNALSQLANYGNANFYVDANLDLHFFQVEAIQSASVLNDSTITDFDMEDDGADIENVMAVNGGSVDTVDDSQQDYSGGSVSTYSSWFAVQFTPKNYDLAEIWLYLQKLQSNGLVPVNDLPVEIRPDNNGAPDPNLLPASASLSSDQVSATAQWTPVDITATLVPGQKYWLVIAGGPSVMSGANNCYLWSYGKSSTGSRPYATSADGETWSVLSGGNAFAFQEWVSMGILASPFDQTSMTAFNLRETPFTDLGLITQPAAGLLGNTLLGVGTPNWGMAKKKRYLTITSLVPDTPINPGESVNVVNSAYGINDWFTCLEAKYQIKGMECLSVAYTLQKFTY